MRVADMINVLKGFDPNAQIAVADDARICTFGPDNVYVHEIDRTVLIDIDQNVFKERLTDGKPGIDE